MPNELQSEQRTPLLGRDAELAQLLEFARAATPRFLTITGPPGVGKTRLLEEFLRAHDTTREVVALSLGGTSSPREALDELSAALKLQAPPGRADSTNEVLITDLTRALEQRGETTLVLDEAEHVIEAIEALSSALAESSADATIIAGTRRTSPLAHQLDLAPLPSDHGASAAVELLLASAPANRAESLREDRRALAELAQRFDGLPLAMTLIAPRLAIMKPRQLLEHIGPRNLDPLQQAIAWSWEQLEQAQRDTLIACAVFESGWTYEGLAAVCADQDSHTLLEHLEQLHACSLIQSIDHGDHFRFDMLATIKSFMLARLAEQPNVDDLRSRHADYYAELAHARYVERHGEVWSAPVKTLVPEYHNLRAALGRRDASNIEATIKTTLGVILAAWRSGRLEEARSRADALYERIEELEELLPKPLFIDMLTLVSDSAGLHWANQRGAEVLERAMKLLPDPEDPSRLPVVGRYAEYLSFRDREKASELIDEAIEITRRRSDHFHEANFLCAKALVGINQGRLTEAIAACEAASELQQEMGDERNLARTRVFHAFAYRRMRNYERMWAPLHQALAVFKEFGDIVAYCHTSRIAIWGLIDERQTERARALLDDLLEVARRHNVHWITGTGRFLSAQLYIEQGNYLDARISYDAAERQFTTEGHTSMIAATRFYKSIALELLGETALAREVFDRGLAGSDGLNSQTGRIQYLCAHANWRARDGALADAHTSLDSAREIAATLEAEDIAHHILQIYTCHVDLVEYLTALEAKKVRKTRALFTRIMSTLSTLRRPDEQLDASPFDAAFEVRAAWYLLEHKLPEEMLRRFNTEMQDPQARALIIDKRARAYRPPGQIEWFDMSRRETPFRLLTALVEQRLEAPGVPLDPDDLFSLVWPDEQIMPDAAQNRMYVTVSALRRDGLKDVIKKEASGYLIDDEVRLLEV